jgi:RNA polymerase sigma factor (sigma-70 family)
MFDLDYEDTELVRQVVKSVFPQLTAMQQHVLLLSATGFTQEDIAEMLHVSQSAVSQHFTKALGRVSATAEELMN